MRTEPFFHSCTSSHITCKNGGGGQVLSGRHYAWVGGCFVGLKPLSTQCTKWGGVWEKPQKGGLSDRRSYYHGSMSQDSYSSHTQNSSRSDTGRIQKIDHWNVWLIILIFSLCPLSIELHEHFSRIFCTNSTLIVYHVSRKFCTLWWSFPSLGVYRSYKFKLLGGK